MQEVEEKRFYIIVPETVQTELVSRGMETGRLMAQVMHIGRVVERRREFSNQLYEDVTTIILSARNTKEMNKILGELNVLRQVPDSNEPAFPLSIYRDHNPPVYKTPDRVLTALCIGPVEKSIVDSAIGHLDLY